MGALKFTELEDEDPDENERSRTFYYPTRLTSRGTVPFRFSVYSPSEISHGAGEFGPADSDFDMWVWIAERPKRFYRVSDDMLESIRREFQAWRRGWINWLLYRLNHRQKSGWVQSLRDGKG